MASPMPTNRTSPTRRSIAAAVTPPAMEPIPWNVEKMPKNEGFSPIAVMTEKISVSEKPTTRSATAMPSTIWRRGSVSQTCCIPAVTSRMK
jgi:hypothetical protein